MSWQTVDYRHFLRAARAVALAALLIGCQRRGDVVAPTCDVNETGINDSTLGPLHIGEAVPALRVRCPAVADTSITEPGSAVPVPAVRLVVVGAPIVIRHEGNKVTALRVESPFFRTNDGLGAGTSIAMFRNLPGIRVQKVGGAPHPVLLDRRRCGVTYELSGWGGPLPIVEGDPLVRGPALVAWTDSTVVRAVTVAGCRGASRDLGVDSIAETATDSAPRPVDTLRSTTGTPVPSPVPVPPPPASVRTAAADSGSIVATPAELAELSARLDVPVHGITRPQLRDTYSESRGSRPHDAIDIPATRGTAVISATDGRVLKLFNSIPGGLMVYATDASERFLLLYGHLDRYAEGVKDGTRLERGQVIGYVGTTGNAPAGTPHLHFAILRGRPKVSWSKGTAVNPYPLLVPPRK